MDDWVRPVHAGWLVRDDVPGPDLDEFADAKQVRATLAGPGADAGPLAVQHPHRTPGSAGKSLAEVLPVAATRLRALIEQYYRPVADVLPVYRVRGVDGTAFGALCVVDPDAVGESGAERVAQTEDVYADVVADRATVLHGLGVATSAAMLVPLDAGDELTVLLADACTGPPSVSIVDHRDRVHELWLLGPGPRRERILRAIGAAHLLVADGNHRLAAARRAGLGGLLALVTAGPDVRIGPIHRALLGHRFSAAELAAAWRGLGLRVSVGVPAEPPEQPGTVVALGTDGVAVAVRLPDPAPGEALPRIDHGVVERLLLGAGLGVSADDDTVRTFTDVPPPGSTVRLLIAPVPYPDVLAVHADGREMPRKSTYFTPKPRSGVLLADLRATGG